MQSFEYSTPENHRKGLQTAGGNKLVLNDAPGAQTILLSNSNNKGTAVEVGFQGDGRITIKSNGPVTVLSPDITLDAGDKGAIKMRAQTIALEAEEITTVAKKTIRAKAKTISAKAENIVSEATKKIASKAMETTIATTQTLEVSGGALLDLKAPLVKINS